jgi:hypothetical protein
MNVGYPNGRHSQRALRAIEAMMAERPDNAGWSRCEGMGECGFGRQAVCGILARADRLSPGRLTGASLVGRSWSRLHAPMQPQGQEARSPG